MEMLPRSSRSSSPLKDPTKTLLDVAKRMYDIYHSYAYLRQELRPSKMGCDLDNCVLRALCELSRTDEIAHDGMQATPPQFNSGTLKEFLGHEGKIKRIFEEPTYEFNGRLGQLVERIADAGILEGVIEEMRDVAATLELYITTISKVCTESGYGNSVQFIVELGNRWLLLSSAWKRYSDDGFSASFPLAREARARRSDLPAETLDSWAQGYLKTFSSSRMMDLDEEALQNYHKLEHMLETISEEQRTSKCEWTKLGRRQLWTLWTECSKMRREQECIEMASELVKTPTFTTDLMRSDGAQIIERSLGRRMRKMYGYLE